MLAALIAAAAMSLPLPAADELATPTPTPMPTQVPDQVLEQVLVTGRRPGPALWKVWKGDHALLILGTIEPLPKKLIRRTDGIQAAILQSQEVLAEPSVSFDIGRFRALTLLPSLIGLRDLPGKATLHDVLPEDVYRRWSALKVQYLPEDRDVERWRPIFAADALYAKAIGAAGFDDTPKVWNFVKQTANGQDIKIDGPRLLLPFDRPHKGITEFKRGTLDDTRCLSATLDRIETDLGTMQARADAWAAGDVAGLSALPYTSHRPICGEALLGSQVIQERGLSDLATRVENAWLDAAEASLADNRRTFAVLPLGELAGKGGMLDALRSRGYTVEAPH